MARPAVRRACATVLATLTIVIALAGVTSAQSTPPRPAPPPPRPSGPSGGGYTPFRDRAFAGKPFSAATFEQPGCPLEVKIEHVEREPRGVAVSMRLSNVAGGSLSRQVLGAWVLSADGTVRGYEKLVATRAIAELDSRRIELVIRTIPVLRNDVIIVAVQEVAGSEAWRMDVKTLEQQIRAAMVP